MSAVEILFNAELWYITQHTITVSEQGVIWHYIMLGRAKNQGLKEPTYVKGTGSIMDHAISNFFNKNFA